jgi:hypothetical protein
VRRWMVNATHKKIPNHAIVTFKQRTNAKKLLN